MPADTIEAKSKKRLSLRWRFLVFALAVAIPLAIVGSVNLLGMWRANRAQLDDSIRQQAALAALTFERWVDAQSQPVRAGAALIDQETETSSAVRNYLRYTIESHPNWIDLRVVSANGETRHVYPRVVEAPPSAVIEYLLAETHRNNSEVVVTDRTRDETQPVIVIAVPVNDGGAVIARIDGVAVKELFQTIELPAGAVIAVFDDEGRILYRRQTTETPIEQEGNGSPLVAVLGNRDEAVVEVESPYDGIRRVYGLARAGRSGDIVIVGIPSARLYEPARQRFSVYLSFSLLALLCAVIAALLIQRSITRPIGELARNAQALGKGDLSVRASTRAPGEIGGLGKAFNTMAEQIAERETRLTELDRMKSEFVGSVSHELRTPLTTIKTLTHVLLHSSLSEPERQEYLETIATECDRQIDLVANLLDLSRIESGGYSVSIAPVVPAEALADAFAFGRHGAQTRNQQLALEPPDGLPFMAADERALARALRILLENAFKYTPEGGEISLSARTDDGAVELSVLDNGQGIATEDIPHLFEKFFRGNPAPSLHDEERILPSDQPGIGLGLYVATGLVEKWGGRISAANRSGGGSIFTIRVPLWKPMSSDTDLQGENS